MLEKLTNIGFRKVGDWLLVDGELKLDLVHEANSKNILYSFVVDGVPVYVGKTVQPLKKRMYGYQNPGPTQSTNIRNNANLIEVLSAGGNVELFALPDHGLMYFGGFHLNLAAALEDSIVSTLQPKWNSVGNATSNKALKRDRPNRAAP